MFSLAKKSSPQDFDTKMLRHEIKKVCGRLPFCLFGTFRNANLWANEKRPVSFKKLGPWNCDLPNTHTHTKSVMFSRKSLGFLLKTCWSTFAKKTANKIWHTDRRMNLANRLPMRSQLAYPYAPCMEYLSIFTIYLSQMQVIIPYNWNCWKKRFPKT